MTDHKWKTHKESNSLSKEDDFNVENAFRNISFITNSYFMGHIDQHNALQEVKAEIEGLNNV
ncbi:hypothetical protein EQ500_16080 [Lactobacillus sp. XV13L]|nr:hypothetical protein [Lactobacillus sp. XV13L]